MFTTMPSLIAALIASFLFASGTVAAKLLSSSLPACAFTLFRYGISSLCLLPFFLIRKEGNRIVIKDLPFLFFLGFTGVFLFNALYFTALSYTSATTVSLIGAIIPVMTVLGAAVFLRQIPRTSELAAIIISFLGVSLLITHGHLSYACFSGSLGEILMLCAVVAEACYILAVKHVSTSYSPLFLSFTTGVTGIIFVIPFIMNYCFLEAIAKLTLFEWALLIYTSSIGTALALIFYSSAISSGNPGRTSLIVFGAMPLFVSTLGYLIFGEGVTFRQAIGGLLIMIALILAERK